MPAKKVSGGSYQFSSTCANPNTPGMVFAPVHCADHFFSGPWPCSCRSGPQEVALTARADEISVGGARGGMKSETLLVFMIKGNIGLRKFPPGAQLTGADATYAAHKNYRGLILIEQANDLGYLIDRADPLYAALGGRITRGNPAECEFPSGAKIIFGYFGEDGWKKYIGPEFQRIAFDQLEKMARRETHDRIIGSLRSRWPEMKTQVFSTWNPGGGDDLKGAPGQAWIMDYFHVEDYISGKFPYGVDFRDTEGSKTRLFIPSKVTDNPFLRWKFEKLPDGVLKQVLAWKCKTCGKTTQSISRPEECGNRACPTNQIAT